MKKLFGAGLAIAAIAGIGIVGCDVGSPDTVLREIGLVIAGYYANPNGGDLVSDNSGAPISTMNLIQNGDDLQGIDNNGRVFRGKVSTATETSAAIQLTGSTTAGTEGTIQATINVSGTSATMQGTWVEASLYGNVYGTATVPTNGGGSGGSITISGSGTVSNNSATTYTASGGSGTHTWTVGNSSLGAITGSGSTAVYAANATDGTQTITVSSGGKTGNKTVTQQ